MPAQENSLDPPPIRSHDSQRPLPGLEGLARLRDTPEAVQQIPRNGLVLAPRYLDLPMLPQHMERRAGGKENRLRGYPPPPVEFGIVLVADISHQLLEQVFQSDHTCSPSMFIHNHGQEGF